MRVKRSAESRRQLLRALRSGGVVVMACDTIYGFVGAVPAAEPVIRKIKGRAETNPFLQLLSDRSDLEKLDVVRPESGILSLWPGPFTFIFGRPDGGSTAFRVPEDESLRELIRQTGRPLYSTSVNRAGEPAMEDPAEIEAVFGQEVELVEDSGIFSGRKPSTIVDLRERPYRIARQGAGIVPARFLKPV